jgi:hypothetical protein
MHLALPLCVLGVVLKIIYTSLFEARLKLKKDKTDDGELANSSAESSRCLSRWQSQRQRNAQRPRGAIIEIALAQCVPLRHFIEIFIGFLKSWDVFLHGDKEEGCFLPFSRIHSTLKIK